MASIDEATIHRAVDDCARIAEQLMRVYQGPREVVESLIVALLARGHALVEGVPGVAKTTLVSAFARSIDAEFKRVQFTPDLMPSDITGTVVLDLSTNTFQLRRGPVFTNILLGDEINRAPAKTQSALLEAMAERQVTIEGTTHTLGRPFVVLATQNPVEQEGVYPLPEAQLDRFLIKIAMSYPSRDDEVRMLATHAAGRPQVETVISGERCEELSELATRVHVGDVIQRYVVDLARATRRDVSVSVGASPRAALALVQASRANALMRGRDYVNVDDVRALALPVFAHRISMAGSGFTEGVGGAEVVREAIRRVPYDPA